MAPSTGQWGGGDQAKLVIRVTERRNVYVDGAYEEQTSTHEFMVFGRKAEAVQRSYKTGDFVVVGGSLRSREGEGGKIYTGVSVTTIEGSPAPRQSKGSPDDY